MTEQALPSAGDRIRLLDMPNDPCPVEAGSLGTVSTIYNPRSPSPQIVVKWDSGRALMLVPGVDRFEVVERYVVHLASYAGLNHTLIEVEACDPDQACVMARRQAETEDQSDWELQEQDGNIPFVTQLDGPAGDDQPYAEEHDEIGTGFPALLATRTAAAAIVEEMNRFSLDCAAREHTDVGAVWALIGAWSERLFRTLPDHVQHAVTAETEAYETQLRRQVD